MTDKSSQARSSTDEAVVHHLNTLTEVCRNGHDGYMEAANGINSAAYKTMFAEYGLQRRRFASQLANLVIEFGGDPDDDGVQDAWNTIRAVMMGGDHGAIFGAIEQAEDAAINAYEKAMEYDDMPTAVREVVDEQCAHLILAHDRIRKLKEAYHKSHT